MVLLKRIKATTLMETLVATVLIVVIFIVASLVLNNLFSNVIRNDTGRIEMRLSEIEYLIVNKKLEVPYEERFGNWSIEVSASIESKYEISATQLETKKTLDRTLFIR